MQGITQKLLVRCQLAIMDAQDRVERPSSSTEDEEGATMIEYALLAGLISIAAVATLKLIGPKILAVFDTVSNAL